MTAGAVGDSTRLVTERLPWRPSSTATRLMLVAAAALAAAMIGHRPELVAFAAPLLGALAMAPLLHRGGVLEIEADPGTARCFEGETVRLCLTCLLGGGRDDLALSLLLPADLEVVDHAETALTDGLRSEWVLRTPRWGRYDLRARLTAHSAAGLLRADVVITAAQVRVYPRPENQAVPLRAQHLPDRIGTHVTRRRGEGVEFGGIRPYVPGDQLRTVNWAASARRGRLHVTERLTERAADVITLIDTYTSDGPTASTPAAREAIDLAVHGAAQVAQAALRRGDRAGVVAVGARLRWLGVELGRKQFYRVVDTVLDGWVTDGDRRDRGWHTDLIPRGAVPAASVVVAFTPLLDARIALTLDNLRLRGHGVLVVDVLRDLPAVDHAGVDPLVARVWRLERGSMHRNLATLGIPVVPWRAGTTLAEVLAPVGRRPVAPSRPTR